MADSISLIGVIVALTLPWLFGYICLRCLMSSSCRWNRWIISGHSYLVGIVLTTLVMRLWDSSGLPLHYWSLVATISALAVGACLVLRLLPVTPSMTTASPAMQKWEVALVILFLLLITYRYMGIAQEIVLRPLYPWDAWMNWAPKAVTWFNLNDLALYISPEDWLQSPQNVTDYTTGARNAWKYPITVPLIQLWGMLGAGSADQTLSNLPWLLAPLAFALALYGHLKLLGASTLLATAACYILLSIPYISVHTALAGYADLWLALAFGAATLSLHEWQQSRHWSWWVLALFFAITCTQLKLPGLVLGAIILTMSLISLLNPSKNTKLIAALSTASLLIYAAFIGISFSVPSVGLVEIVPGKIALPYLGTFQLEYQSVHHALIETIFHMINWNTLWYLPGILLIIKLISKAYLQPASLELQAITLLMLFLLFIFYFTHFSEFILDYSTVNRVLLYAVPVMVFYLFKSTTLWKPSDCVLRTNVTTHSVSS